MSQSFLSVPFLLHIEIFTLVIIPDVSHLFVFTLAWVHSLLCLGYLLLLESLVQV
jgi:hypothetical protein